jgi:hypothetical protein
MLGFVFALAGDATAKTIATAISDAKRVGRSMRKRFMPEIS